MSKIKIYYSASIIDPGDYPTGRYKEENLHGTGRDKTLFVEFACISWERVREWIPFLGIPRLFSRKIWVKKTTLRWIHEDQIHFIESEIFTCKEDKNGKA